MVATPLRLSDTSCSIERRTFSLWLPSVEEEGSTHKLRRQWWLCTLNLYIMPSLSFCQKKKLKTSSFFFFSVGLCNNGRKRHLYSRNLAYHNQVGLTSGLDFWRNITNQEYLTHNIVYIDYKFWV